MKIELFMAQRMNISDKGTFEKKNWAQKKFDAKFWEAKNRKARRESWYLDKQFRLNLIKDE